MTHALINRKINGLNPVIDDGVPDRFKINAKKPTTIKKKNESNHWFSS